MPLVGLYFKFVKEGDIISQRKLRLLFDTGHRSYIVNKMIECYSRSENLVLYKSLLLIRHDIVNGYRTPFLESQTDLKP